MTGIRISRRGYIALVLWLVTLLALPAGAASILQVTDLQASHRNGQTFLTWDAQPGPSVTYRIYRSTTQIVRGADLPAAQLLGEIGDSSAYNWRLSSILGWANYYRIDSSQPPLNASSELFVRTVSSAGVSYYAVTRLSGGIEDTSIIAGQNALLLPVSESPGAPNAVWQMLLSGITHIYVHWADSSGHDGYRPMANAPSIPFNFGLQKKGSDPLHPLVVRPHARGGYFLSAGSGTSNSEEWLLQLDDPIPNDIRNTIWHGYHTGFDLATGAGIPDTGIVVDYTMRRMRWTLEWVISRFPIDTNRIYGVGGSMGGVGVVFMGMMAPHRFAAVYAITPKFDFSFLNDPDPVNVYNTGGEERDYANRLWGTVATNLPSSDGIPTYDRLNAGYLARMKRSESLPVMITFNGKNDVLVGWAEKIGFYTSMQAERHGSIFFFDSREHGGGASLREWLTEQDPDILYRYRLDQSYPAFSYAQCNEDPGDGHATNGDTYGTINGRLGWDPDIVDTTDRYEVTLRLVNLRSIYGVEPPPESTRTDVTLRRLQRFDVNAYASFEFTNRDTTGAVIETGIVVPDTSGLLTISSLFVSRGGNRLVIVPSTTPPVPDTLTISVNESWNIVSVPLVSEHINTDSIFPGATSPAFAYSSGYQERDTLQWGVGYWLKFQDSADVTITGSVVVPDTITVSAGWNLVGSTIDTVAVGSIMELPGGILDSGFYEFEQGYRPVDGLLPGRGYWVKIKTGGKLVLPRSTW